MGIISTGITEGKGRAGVMIPIPGYSMYQARLLQHNTHQVIPIRVTWRRFPRSLFQAFKQQNTVIGLNRTRRKRGESGTRARELSLSSLSRYFFPRQFFDRALLSERLEQLAILPSRSDTCVASHFQELFSLSFTHFPLLNIRSWRVCLEGAAEKNARRVECLHTLRSSYRGFTSLFTLADQSNQACISDC